MTWANKIIQDIRPLFSIEACCTKRFTTKPTKRLYPVWTWLMFSRICIGWSRHKYEALGPLCPCRHPYSFLSCAWRREGNVVPIFITTPAYNACSGGLNPRYSTVCGHPPRWSHPGQFSLSDCVSGWGLPGLHVPVPLTGVMIHLSGGTRSAILTPKLLRGYYSHICTTIKIWNDARLE